jgi:ADP-ribosylation factor-binding protein GGA
MLPVSASRPWSQMTQVQSLVGKLAVSLSVKSKLTTSEQACDPTLPEPNYPVMVELVDMIKAKKANRYYFSSGLPWSQILTYSAREATHALLGNINSRNPNQSLLGLAVLDHLVKNGGYPIHLQIATKEFLNELVRRFPERPPMVTGRVMGRILEVGTIYRVGEIPG